MNDELNQLIANSKEIANNVLFSANNSKEDITNKDTENSCTHSQADEKYELVKSKEKGNAMIVTETGKEFIVKNQELYIGRCPKSSKKIKNEIKHEKKNFVLYQIGDSNKISRIAAKIFYSNNEGWFIQSTSLSKKIYLNKNPIQIKDGPIKLSKINAIQIYKLKFYFNCSHKSN